MNGGTCTGTAAWCCGLVSCSPGSLNNACTSSPFSHLAHSSIQLYAKCNHRLVGLFINWPMDSICTAREREGGGSALFRVCIMIPWRVGPRHVASDGGGSYERSTACQRACEQDANTPIATGSVGLFFTLLSLAADTICCSSKEIQNESERPRIPIISSVSQAYVSSLPLPLRPLLPSQRQAVPHVHHKVR